MHLFFYRQNNFISSLKLLNHYTIHTHTHAKKNVAMTVYWAFIVGTKRHYGVEFSTWFYSLSYGWFSLIYGLNGIVVKRWILTKLYLIKISSSFPLFCHLLTICPHQVFFKNHLMSLSHVSGGKYVKKMVKNLDWNSFFCLIFVTLCAKSIAFLYEIVCFEQRGK